MKQAKQKTFMAKPDQIERKCYLIDAENKVLGKVAAKAASLLRGKHKMIYTPHVDTGDMVVIINAGKIKVTGAKMTDKTYQRYSGYPSGQRTLTMEQLKKKAPTKVVELAVRGMVPKGPLGNKMKTKLKVYAGQEHPHKAQQPVACEI